MKKKILWILFSIVILFGLILGLGFHITRRGLPIMEGTIKTGVLQEVKVMRDSLGIPHLQGSSLEDLFFAQGYIQAMDRLWQMDVYRRATTGRLGEIFGEGFLETDIFLRSLLMGYTAKESISKMDLEILELLQHYVNGVNAYIQDHRNNLSFEFLLLGYRPEEWRLEDTLGIGKFMAFELGGNMATEIFLWTALKSLPEAMVFELFPSYPEDGTTIVSEEMKRGETAGLLSLLQILSALSSGSSQDLGSNNWVLGGEKTSSGKPLLANDMHLVMGLPSIWYQTRLEIPGHLNLHGVIFPGIPGIIVGSNNYLSFGVTNLGPDVQDLYRERRHPEHPYLFEYDGAWKEALILEEEFLIKGKDSFQTEIVVTHNGPIIYHGEEPLSLRWTAHDYTQEVEAIIQLTKARDWEEFQEALNYFHVPAQNFIMADRDGNIGYRGNGRIPIRKKGDGLLPAPGWDPDYQWQGYIPYHELPSLYNPEEGFISTANNRVISKEYPYPISYEWAPPYRAQVIHETLSEGNNFRVQDMKDLQMNTTNLQASLLLPLIQEDLFSFSWEEKEAQALETLYSWGQDPRDDPQKAGPAIYHTLYLKALEETFSEAMGEDLYQEFLQLSPVNTFDRMIKEGSLWFQEGGGRGPIFIRAFQATVLELVGKLGPEISKWQWGDLHQIYLTHHLSQAPVLRRFLNDGPYPIGGSHLTVNASPYSFLNPYLVTISAPWRFIVHLVDPMIAWENLAGGISGHPFSPHYRDQTSFWLEGEYTEVLLEGYRMDRGKLLSLRPQQ